MEHQIFRAGIISSVEMVSSLLSEFQDHRRFLCVWNEISRKDPIKYLLSKKRNRTNRSKSNVASLMAKDVTLARTLHINSKENGALLYEILFDIFSSSRFNKFFLLIYHHWFYHVCADDIFSSKVNFSVKMCRETDLLSSPQQNRSPVKNERNKK